MKLSTLSWWTLVVGSCVVIVQGDDESDTAISARTEHYYDEMWFRFWTFPVVMAIKAKVIMWVLFITYFSTIMQAIAYQRSEPEVPEIYSVPDHAEWGHPSFTSWG